MFSAKLDNYKQNASIYKLFEGGNKLSPDDKTDSYFIVMESITTINTEKNDDYLPTDLKDKDVRILSYKILLEKFNEKYTNLTGNQKAVLKEYINSISNSNEFNKFVNSKLPTLKKSLKSRVENVKDKVLRIKLTEAINCVDKFCLNESKKTQDDTVVQLLRYYELDKELRKIK